MQTKVSDQHETHRGAIKSARVPELKRKEEREDLTEMIDEWKRDLGVGFHMETECAVLVLCNKSSKSAEAHDGSFVISCSLIRFSL